MGRGRATRCCGSAAPVLSFKVRWHCGGGAVMARRHSGDVAAAVLVEAHHRGMQGVRYAVGRCRAMGPGKYWNDRTPQEEGGVTPSGPPPPPSDQSDHRGKQRNVLLGKSDRAILVHKLFGLRPPSPPPSNPSLGPGQGGGRGHGRGRGVRLGPGQGMGPAPQTLQVSVCQPTPIRKSRTTPSATALIQVWVVARALPGPPACHHTVLDGTHEGGLAVGVRRSHRVVPGVSPAPHAVIPGRGTLGTGEIRKHKNLAHLKCAKLCRGI